MTFGWHPETGSHLADSTAKGAVQQKPELGLSRAIPSKPTSNKVALSRVLHRILIPERCCESFDVFKICLNIFRGGGWLFLLVIIGATIQCNAISETFL